MSYYIRMADHLHTFITTLYKFLSDLNRYQPNPTIESILESFGDLDKAELIFRLNKLVKYHGEKIITKDDALFSNDFFIVKNVNVSTLDRKSVV